MNHITNQPVKRSHHTNLGKPPPPRPRHLSRPPPNVAGNSPQAAFNTTHNVAIPTIPFTCLKGLHGNCMRHCWQTTTRGDKTPNRKDLEPKRQLKAHKRPHPMQPHHQKQHPSGSAAPITEPCTRSGALHPIRRGALRTDRVQHPNTQEQTRNWQTEPLPDHARARTRKQPRPRPTGIGDEAGAG